MSSRAIRKAQKEREAELQAAQIQKEQEEGEDDEGLPLETPKPSIFAVLGDNEIDIADEEDDADNEVSTAPQTPPENAQKRGTTGKSKKRKKKATKQASSKDFSQQSRSSEDAKLDEIDLALKALSNFNLSSDDRKEPQISEIDESLQEICRLLSIDVQHLHASNEMRRLFGRAALESADEDDEGGPGGGGGVRRQRRAQQQQIGLAGAIAGRGGRTQGLAGLSRRRNPFIQGREEWPQITGGGLGMEIVERRSDGTIEYRIVHSRTYQDVQRQFESCVASMDPQRLVVLLQHNRKSKHYKYSSSQKAEQRANKANIAYHISTLLQVSEIAKQERDHATAGDLLERALFSFGRAAHSTFTNSLSQGKARLDFRRPENRELWLAAWRYIGNLGMRSTWRTAYEWAKLLLSLDPMGDPYRVSLTLDQFALRAKQAQSFLDISGSKMLAPQWDRRSNILISRVLAHAQVKDIRQAKQILFTLVGQYPWVFNRLYQELDLGRTPAAIWDKQARTLTEALHCELYVRLAKDLWSTPEAKDLLVEVAPAVASSGESPVDDSEITLAEARHTILTDMPALIELLPRKLTTRYTSTSDPLPPLENIPSYSLAIPSSNPSSTTDSLEALAAELDTLRQFFHQLFPWLRTTASDDVNSRQDPPTAEEVERVVRESGVDPRVLVRNMMRMQELQAALTRSAGGQPSGREAEDEEGSDRHGEQSEDEDERWGGPAAG